MYLRKREQIVIYICYLKVLEAQVGLSTLLDTTRVCVNSSFFGYFDGLEKYTFKELWENLHHRCVANYTKLGKFVLLKSFYIENRHLWS